MIQVSHVSKSYGPVQALQDVSLEISSGEIVGLLGPNGAGKTTLMKVLTGYLQPDEGDVIVDELDVIGQPRLVQERIGYLPENAPLYPELSVQSYLMMMAELREVPESEQIRRVQEAILSTGLAEYAVRPIGQLSKGLRQRVGLAQAILHQPRILILDEPTIGLDPTQVVEVRELIRRLAQESTVLFSTHILSEVEALCDRVIILIHGEMKADARLSELAASPDAILVLEHKVEGVEDMLAKVADVRELNFSQTPEGYARYSVRGGAGMKGADLCPVIYQLVRDESWPLRELKQDTRTLETVFNELATTG